MMSIPDNIFARNMNFAGGLQYDLERVHGTGVADTLQKISDNLMIDAQSLSVCLRATAAFHEDEAKVLLANVPQRAKSINEFTLLITTMGMLILCSFKHHGRRKSLVVK
jgi:hypothetical protein